MSQLARIGPRAAAYDPREHGAACDLCPLRKNTVVPPEGPASGRVRLVIVGEGPGGHEENHLRPFIGASGQFLNRKLEEASAGVDLRKDAWVTNATLCRPDGENQEKEAAVCCAPRLYRELAQLPADAPILALGKSATMSLLNVRSILLSRGFIWTAKEIDASAIEALKRKADKTGYAVDKLKWRILRGRAKLAGRKVFPTIHPAFVLRLDTWHPVLKVDVDRFVRYYRGEIAEPLEDVGPYKVFRTPEKVERALYKLRRDVAAVDIETDGVNPLIAPILCVGVGDGYHGVVIRWDDDENKKNSYIPELARILSKFLATRQHVVMHNGWNFDRIALQRDGVELTVENQDDTLFGLHSFASHLPKRLDWAGSIYNDAAPWKIVFGRKGAEEKGILPVHLPPAVRHKYNFADIQMTGLAWRRMQDDLAPERHIYDHDQQLGAITMQMQVDGFAVDWDRKELLAREAKLAMIRLKHEMRRMTRKQSFSPAKLDDVRWAIFERFGAPVFAITETGLPSTNNGTIEALKSDDTEVGIFCTKLLQWRAISKTRSTYIQILDELVLDDMRAHYNWRVFGTVSGRWSCRLQSAPKWSAKIEDRAREQYVAPVGCCLLYFDLSQSEMRGAAYLSGDKKFIEVCESGDVHSGNASILFPEARDALRNDPKGKYCPSHREVDPDKDADCNCGKPFRDIAKNAGFGILYSAEIKTIFGFLRSKGFNVSLNQVQAMFDGVHETYSRYYEYCEENLEFCKKNGWQRTAILKRRRQIGYFPKQGDVYNFMVQSLIADLMNLRLIEFVKRTRGLRGVRVVAQIHDALIIECPEKYVARVRNIVTEIWAVPVYVEESGCTFVMPIDMKEADRWSSFG